MIIRNEFLNLAFKLGVWVSNMHISSGLEGICIWKRFGGSNQKGGKLDLVTYVLFNLAQGVK